MDPREKLLQSLMQDLENYQLPERWDEAKKTQVMKGRKGQADIDAGRAAIAENERAYQDAVTQRRQLQTQISQVKGEIDTAKGEAQANSPYEQGRQIALFGVPAAGGMALGYGKGVSVSRGLRERATERAASVQGLADDVRSNTIPRADAARTSQRLRMLGPTRHSGLPLAVGVGLTGVGAAQRALAPKLTDNPTGQDVVRALGGLESGIGMGLAAQQLGSVLKGLPQPAARDVAMIDDIPPGTPPASPPGGTPPNQPPAPVQNSKRLINAARAAGATGKLTKSQAEAYLKKAGTVTDANRTAVAEALGAKPGEKLPGVIKRLGSSRSASSIIAPLIAGGLTYDAVTGEARAEGATPGEARTRGAVAGTGAAAATTGALYGAKKAGEYLGPKMAANALGRAALRAVPVAGAALTAYDVGRGVNALAHLSPPQEAGDYSTMGAFMPEGNALAQAGGESVVTERDRPMMQAAALEVPGNIPPDAAARANVENGMAAAGAQPDAFGQALQEFLAFANEMGGE